MPEPVTVPVTAVVRLLLTRGTEWGRDFAGLRDWRIVEMAAEPHLLTCKRRGKMSACLTPIEAARVTLRRYPAAELYMWDQPNYIPGHSLQGHKAVRVVGTSWRGIPA